MNTALYQILQIVQRTFNALAGVDANLQQMNTAIATMAKIQAELATAQINGTLAMAQAFQQIDQRLDGIAAEQLDQATTLETILTRVSPQPAVATYFLLGSPEPQ